jgi:hypothetical protein
MDDISYTRNCMVFDSHTASLTLNNHTLDPVNGFISVKCGTTSDGIGFCLGGCVLSRRLHLKPQASLGTCMTMLESLHFREKKRPRREGQDLHAELGERQDPKRVHYVRLIS